MSKHFKVRGLVTIFFVVAVSLVTFAACNPEIYPTTQEETQVSFIPSTSKALNQTGETLDTSAENVSIYHWKYKCAESKQALDATSFTDFAGQTSTDTGLGVIYNLVKGNTYWFALEGWTVEDTPKRLWYGETTQGFVLSSKTALVTISVSPVGKGALYFAVEAPVANYMTIQEDRAIFNDRFVVETITTLDGTIVSSNTNLEATFNSDSESFIYNSVGKEADFTLPSGTYMVVVKQQTTINGENYVDVDGRKTIIIITIQSGVNTIIKGSMDSSAMQVLTYNAGAEGSDEGMEVAFLSATNLGKTLGLKARYSSGSDYPVLNNSALNVKDKEYVTLVYSTKTDVTDTLKIYVNKTMLDLTSKTDLGFIRDIDGKTTLIKNNVENEILAYGEDGNTYIVTVRYDNLSKSFSIVGVPSDFT